jgi:hypothetical protein
MGQDESSIEPCSRRDGTSVEVTQNPGQYSCDDSSRKSKTPPGGVCQAVKQHDPHAGPSQQCAHERQARIPERAGTMLRRQVCEGIIDEVRPTEQRRALIWLLPGRMAQDPDLRFGTHNGMLPHSRAAPCTHRYHSPDVCAEPRGGLPARFSLPSHARRRPRSLFCFLDQRPARGHVRDHPLR